MDATLKALDLHLAKESYGAALLALIDGTGSDEAVAAAETRVARCELAIEIGREYVTSHYATNGGR